LAGRTRIAWLAALVILCAVVPLLNLVVPAGSVFHISDFMVALVGKIMCYAICALAMDLIWGYTGILSLGHGLFFALGGYVMGMYLMREIGLDGNYKNALPDFMVFLDWKALPWHWALSDSFAATLALVVLAPGLLALVFGYFAFRSRIKGVYFSILTQALTYGASLMFFRNDMLMGGNNGFTDFRTLLGANLRIASTQRLFYISTAILLIIVVMLCKWLTHSRFGLVQRAIRDSENRVLFSGYSTANFKLFIFVVSAVIAALAGALYVPQVGIINPSEMTPEKSLEAVVWVALGGRGTLVGPVLGAISVNALKSWATREFPDLWLLFLGTSFVLVVMFMPKGMIGLPSQIQALAKRMKRKSSDP
jgi:urea transport system permease protein